MSLVTLDHLENIQLNTENPLFLNMHALSYLPVGLAEIARYVLMQENKLAGPNVPMHFISFSGDPEIAFIACNFHWFSVSLVNYLRLVGFVEIGTKNGYQLGDLTKKEVRKAIKTHCDDYVKKVIPNIERWRNKFAAHFAITAPYEDDHIAFLGASAIMPVSFTKPYYYVSEYRPAMLPATHNQIERWSLTETYESLKPRLWPQLIAQNN